MAISGTDLMEVPTIYFLAYVLGLYKFQGISPENMIKIMLLLYLHVLDPEIPIDLIDGSGQWPRVRVQLP